jgi:hypothetical protein
MFDLDRRPTESEAGCGGAVVVQMKNLMPKSAFAVKRID